MKTSISRFFTPLVALVVVASFSPKVSAQDADEPAAEEITKTRIAELDAYWAEVSRAVGEGDFAAYRATCHEEGVLVSGTRNYSQPLSTALARWKAEFDATREGRMKAGVEFRLSQRLGDATTAYETGIFRYFSQLTDAEPNVEYVVFEAVLVKKEDGWKILMEYQKSLTSEAEWNALK